MLRNGKTSCAPVDDRFLSIACSALLSDYGLRTMFIAYAPPIHVDGPESGGDQEVECAGTGGRMKRCFIWGN